MGQTCHLDLLKMVGKSSNIFFQMMVKDGDQSHGAIPEHHPKEIQGRNATIKMKQMFR